MSDILCSVCGEPWDAYGVRNGDMDPAEARRFLSGQGCPSCDFGQSCPLCRGTGKEPCPNRCFPKDGKRYHYLCGPLTPCTSCQDGHTPELCSECNGSGRPFGGDPLAGAQSELDWSDEDPILILQRRRLL